MADLVFIGRAQFGAGNIALRHPKQRVIAKTAAASALESQAGDLVQVVSVFKLAGGASNASTYRAPAAPKVPPVLSRPAMAPKSNAAYKAFNEAKAFVKKDGTRPVPMHLRNAPTKLMKELDYGKGYRYAHDEEGGFAAGEQYLPDGMVDTNFYRPVDRGLEIRIGEKLRDLKARNHKQS